MHLTVYHLRRTVCLVLLAISFAPAIGQNELPPPDSAYEYTDTAAIQPLPPRHIVIGAKPSPPFLYEENGAWTGISYQLWELIAGELNISYSFKELTLPGILNGLENCSIDLSINPLTVTSSRIQRIDFTQPFYTSHCAVAAHVQKGKTAWSYVKQFFSLSFLKVILLLVLILLAFGAAVWFFERKANPQEFSNNLKGLWSGLWWSAVTMTTVGYGDKSPRSFGGRMVGLVWMFTAVIIISSFTASITSALTIDQLSTNIKELNDLRRLRVGTVGETATAQYLSNNSVRHRNYVDVSTGLQDLEDGNLDAFVYDEPILRYYLEKMTLPKSKILPLKLNPQYYSFSVPKGSKLAAEINPILLKEIESITWKLTLTEYGLGED
jgi:ABC-type amino acid transport substrate-binding protein